MPWEEMVGRKKEESAEDNNDEEDNEEDDNDEYDKENVDSSIWLKLSPSVCPLVV